MNKLRNIALIFSSLFLLSCSSTSDVDAVPLRYSEPRFQDQAPIELNVEKVDIIKSAKLWAEDRLKANGFSSNKVAEFIIKDASVTEEIEKSEELLQKDRLKYRANLSVVLKITDKTNMSAAETSINAWRELKIPVDTKIAEKEKYWNDMVYKLFDEFNRRMEKNINEYLNMYVMNNYSIKEYQE